MCAFKLWSSVIVLSTLNCLNVTVCKVLTKFLVVLRSETAQLMNTPRRFFPSFSCWLLRITVRLIFTARQLRICTDNSVARSLCSSRASCIPLLSLCRKTTLYVQQISKQRNHRIIDLIATKQMKIVKSMIMHIYKAFTTSVKMSAAIKFTAIVQEQLDQPFSEVWKSYGKKNKPRIYRS